MVLMSRGKKIPEVVLKLFVRRDLLAGNLRGENIENGHYSPFKRPKSGSSLRLLIP